MTVESNICTRCARSLKEASASKKVSNTPLRLKRQKRFQKMPWLHASDRIRDRADGYFEPPDIQVGPRAVTIWS